MVEINFYKVLQSRPVSGVGIAAGWLECPTELASVEVIHGGHPVRLGPHHLVLDQARELQILLVLELLLLVKEVPNTPELAVGRPPAARGDDQLAVPAGLYVVHIAVMALVGGLLAGLEVVHLDISHVGSSEQELTVP